MKTFIVPWREIVGKDYMEQFTKMTKAWVFANRDPVAQAGVLKKFTPEEWEEYDKKRYFMRFCGYAMDGEITRRHGWNDPYLEKGELRFKCTARREDRRTISWHTFIEWRNTHDKDAGEGQDTYAEAPAERKYGSQASMKDIIDQGGWEA